MVRILSAALLLVSSSASAAPLALPSFEGAAADLGAQVRDLRAAAVRKADAGIGAKLDDEAWGLRRDREDAGRLRDDLRLLMTRVDAPVPGRPDPNLEWDLQQLVRDLQGIAQDAQWRLSDVRALSSQIAGKDASIAAPAQRLADSAVWLQSDVHWLVFDEGFDTADLQRRGFAFEAMDLDRAARDLDQAAQSLKDESARLLAKAR